MNDELDAEIVEGSTGIDYWQVLKKMYLAQGEKWLENYRKEVSKDLVKFRHTKLYTDFDFKRRKWIGADQIDLVFSLRSRIMAERLLKHLSLMVSKLDKC